MRICLLLFFPLIIVNVLVAQPKEKIITYPVLISFQSECCGVPSDSSVRNFVNAFKNKYKIETITAEHIGPMGREGEYYLGFTLNELSKKKAGFFITKIKKIKKLPRDRGLLVVKEKVEIDPATLPGRVTGKKIIF